ncbi:purple acid phosphatase family protein [Hufsiella ginkgonis]|uniref:Metallophosphoesterase n=1 Tax=Hufsiella ginkgonis TaxID=2695274 RepID=A0A7K1XY08_9SPHI|nr:metallophosphoesterase family protein [Hufsiella ginkgonis]MXV15629.1 metallophosphoesterase [Hufsiella ginkgonis]
MRIVNTLLLLLLSFASFAQEGAAIRPLRRGPMGVQPELLRGPYLQMATPTGMTIRWRTNVFDHSRVQYGSAPDRLDRRMDDSTLVNEHIITLTGLKPFTKYYYTIGGLADTILQGNADNYFYTLPEKDSDQLIRVAGFGDCGNNSINQRTVRDQAIKYLGDNYLNAWILMGDNAYNDGTDAEFQAKFFNIYKDNLLKKYPLYPVPGNHDYNNYRSSSIAAINKIAYYQNFSLPAKGEAGGIPSGTESYYSYDIGPVHFLALDSYGPDKKGTYMYNEMGEQAEWVKKDLDANKSKWVVAYWHHPPYTMGSHDSNTEQLLVKIRQNFIKILEDRGVDLVLCGHSHVYERTRLIKGYYGMEADYDAQKYEISSSTGLYDGTKNSAPYLKSTKNNEGTVYVVSGSSGALGGHMDNYPHNAMYYSNNEVGGIVLLEAQGNRLSLKWITGEGKVGDHFTMMKDVSPADEKALKQDKQLSRE